MCLYRQYLNCGVDIKTRVSQVFAACAANVAFATQLLVISLLELDTRGAVCEGLAIAFAFVIAKEIVEQVPSSRY